MIPRRYSILWVVLLAAAVYVRFYVHETIGMVLCSILLLPVMVIAVYAGVQVIRKRCRL